MYVQGNVYISNSLTTTNISSQTIYYGEDITKRAPYLTPGADNGPIIQAWISATCNASSQPTRSWWSTSATPVFGNVITGTSGFQGGVLIPGGRIVFVPGTNSSVGFYTPKTLKFEKVIIPAPNESSSGGVLLPTGNVIFCPQTSNIGVFNPLSFAFSNGASLPGGQYSGVLTANNVKFAPKGVPSNIISWNYTTGVANKVWALASSTIQAWSVGNMPNSQTWNSAAWSPQLGIFVVVAANTNRMNYSTDGKIWMNPVNSGTGNGMTASLSWNSVVWSPQLGLFVAIASGSAIMNYSTDGTNWMNPVTAGTGTGMTASLTWSRVVWSPQLGLFVAIATSSATLNYSADGKNWSASSIGTSRTWRTHAWSPQLGLFVAFAQASLTGYYQAPRLQQGACLLPNGNVIIPSPGTANVIQFDPVGLAASNITVGTDGFSSLILTPNGNVIGVPQNSNILVINPSTFISSNVQVPQSNANCMSFFNAGCLMPSGNIIFAPSVTLTANVGSSNAIVFDPGSLTFSNSTSIGSSFTSATLVQSGQVIFGGANVGIYDTMTPVSTEFCMSPYFNKF